jgi:hypothetical protein
MRIKSLTVLDQITQRKKAVWANLLKEICIISRGYRPDRESEDKRNHSTCQSSLPLRDICQQFAIS